MDKRFYIESLDGIRAIAFLLVFIAHCGAQHLVPGGFGVTVFFFLSGYLITTLLRMEYERTHTIDLSKFYLRRVFRIFPSQYLVFFIALALCLAGVLPGQPSLYSVALQFLQLTNYLTVESTEMVPYGTGIYWSLSVEEHFYLLFPFALALLLKKWNYQRITFLLFAICMVLLAWRLALTQLLPVFEERIYRGTDTRIDSILFGCIMALGFNPKLDKPVAQPWIWAMLCGGASIVLGFTFLMKDAVARETIRYTIQGIALVPLFYSAIRYAHWPVFQPLHHSWIRHVGVLSYGLYLVHYVVIYFVKTYSFTSHFVVHSLFALAISLGLAQLMHVGIEKPSLRLRKRFGI